MTDQGSARRPCRSALIVPHFRERTDSVAGFHVWFAETLPWFEQRPCERPDGHEGKHRNGYAEWES